MQWWVLGERTVYVGMRESTKSWSKVQKQKYLPDHGLDEGLNFIW